jgi:6-phospho-3-hexuloisomerase
VSVLDTLKTVTNEVRECLLSVDAAEIEAALALLDSAPRIFVAGAGRSGLAMRAFAMRLMHLGVSAYVVGGTVTPAMSAGDVLVIGSGSGRTESLLAIARKAKGLGGRLVLFTIDAESPLAELAEVTVGIPAPSPKARSGPEAAVSVQPMGSVFEQALLLLGDAIIFELMRRRGVESQEMFARHANLE